MKKLRVGDTCEVIEIVNLRPIVSVYSNGMTGIAIKNSLTGFGVDAFIGIESNYGGGWYVREKEYRKVGRLTVTKVK